MYYWQWRIQDFPLGGVDLVEGGVDSWGGYVSKILYVETKESGPRRTSPLDPPMMEWLMFKSTLQLQPALSPAATDQVHLVCK